MMFSFMFCFAVCTHAYMCARSTFNIHSYERESLLFSKIQMLFFFVIAHRNRPMDGLFVCFSLLSLVLLFFFFFMFFSCPIFNLLIWWCNFFYSKPLLYNFYRLNNLPFLLLFINICIVAILLLLIFLAFVFEAIFFVSLSFEFQFSDR